MPYKIKRRFGAVIFDIDNVLVDTRASYTDCIRKTVQYYLENRLGFSPARTPLLLRGDVEKFKLLGGFNDDWDTCYGLILYLLSLKPKSHSASALKKEMNLDAFSRRVKTPLYVSGIERLCGKNRLVSIKRVARIFQKWYESTYVKREKPILPKSLFRVLHDRGIGIGIATGRNRREAVHALKRCGISNQVGSVITIDDLPNSTFKKPHPYSLLKIADHFGRKLEYLYVGDLPDDIQTAKRAAKKIRVRAWGFSFASADRNRMSKSLKRAGAFCVMKTPGELVRRLLRLLPRSEFGKRVRHQSP